MLLATDLAVLDHHDGSVLLIANAINYDASDARVDEAWSDAVARLDAMQADLAAPAAPSASTYDPAAEPQVTSRTAQPTTSPAVEACREHIRAGDAFQIVLSPRFTAPCPADPLDVYRVLRVDEPQPVHVPVPLPDVGGTAPATRCRRGGFDVVGSSPEALVKVDRGGRCCTRSPASRPRGATPEAGHRPRRASCWPTRRSAPST